MTDADTPTVSEFAIAERVLEWLANRAGSIADRDALLYFMAVCEAKRTRLELWEAGQ